MKLMRTCIPIRQSRESDDSDVLLFLVVDKYMSKRRPLASHSGTKRAAGVLRGRELLLKFTVILGRLFSVYELSN